MRGTFPKDTPADWPAIEHVRAYVERCRQRVDENLERAPGGSHAYGARTPADASGNACVHVSQFPARLEKISARVSPGVPR